MDKDRIKGSAQQAKGKVKEVAGKATGDKKTEAEGKTEKAAGCRRHEGRGAREMSGSAEALSLRPLVHTPITFWNGKSLQATHMGRT